MSILSIENLTKIYNMGEFSVQALKNISLRVEKGEFLAITGQSGSGKSTLMHILGCLDRPTDGKYIINGIDLSLVDNNQLANLRSKSIGFVFQKFNLLKDLTALDNVALSQLYAGENEDIARKKAKKLLSLVQLENRADHYPYQLSGGQQQRVAIARALINDPAILLADEPTGNLDSDTGHIIMDFLNELNKTQNRTIVLVTHEPNIALRTKRIIELLDGKIIKDIKNQ